MSENEPDSGMASGSDAGEPGDRSDARPLRPDEEALLGALEERGGEPGGALAQEVPEESEAAGRAAADEAPLPADGGPQDDGLAPDFAAPDE